MKVAIVDDHDIFRQSLALLLSHRGDHRVLGDFDSPEALLESQDLETPDCILLDYHMPEVNPLQALRRLQQRWPQVRVVFLTGTGSGAVLSQLLDSPAQGLLHKRDSAEVILESLERLAQGERVISAQVQPEIEAVEFDFTAKELEVLQCLLRGLTPAQIAEQLFLSKRTVEKHKENMMRKAGLHNLAQLLELGHRLTSQV
jgi:DNA-binding NarL/FixJ family response regulator